MIEVTVDDVIVRVLRGEEEGKPARIAKWWQRVVLLHEKEGERVLPVWTGSPEADVLAFHLWGGSRPRPMTVELTLGLLEAAGARIERVAVDAEEWYGLHATVTLAAAGRSHEIDARPTDAVNLAVRTGAPIFVDEQVMARRAVVADDIDTLVEERVEREPGEWRSLSPELLRTIYAPSGG